ncbi:MAG: TPM domain-containing protein [Bacteroidales bacterium]|nr:TPM domain-containing protein [Bacteroidales bacterium]
MGLEKFLKDEEQRAVVAAIVEAEACTSGEIRVHVEPKCKCGNPLDRAVEVFGKLGMHETRERNGVLIYIAYASRQFAIIGDRGIDERVPADFWENEKRMLASYLREGRPCEGLCKVIGQVGVNLSEYFPHKDDDVNEQSDEISYSD